MEYLSEEQFLKAKKRTMNNYIKEMDCCIKKAVDTKELYYKIDDFKLGEDSETVYYTAIKMYDFDMNGTKVQDLAIHRSFSVDNVDMIGFQVVDVIKYDFSNITGTLMFLVNRYLVSQDIEVDCHDLLDQMSQEIKEAFYDISVQLEGKETEEEIASCYTLETRAINEDVTVKVILSPACGLGVFVEYKDKADIGIKLKRTEVN